MTPNTLIIPFLPADVAVEIRKRTLPDGKRRIESLLNDGTLSVNTIWRADDGTTQFDPRTIQPSGYPGLAVRWSSPDSEYASIIRRHPRNGDWVVIRAESA